MTRCVYWEINQWRKFNERRGIPNIPDEEKTPVILQLVEIIEQISVVNLQQAEEIQLYRWKIATGSSWAL